MRAISPLERLQKVNIKDGNKVIDFTPPKMLNVAEARQRDVYENLSGDLATALGIAERPFLKAFSDAICTSVVGDAWEEFVNVVKIRLCGGKTISDLYPDLWDDPRTIEAPEGELVFGVWNKHGDGSSLVFTVSGKVRSAQGQVEYYNLLKALRYPIRSNLTNGLHTGVRNKLEARFDNGLHFLENTGERAYKRRLKELRAVYSDAHGGKKRTDLKGLIRTICWNYEFYLPYLNKYPTLLGILDKEVMNNWKALGFFLLPYEVCLAKYGELFSTANPT